MRKKDFCPIIGKMFLAYDDRSRIVKLAQKLHQLVLSELTRSTVNEAALLVLDILMAK